MTKHLLPIWRAFEQQSLAGAPAMQKTEMQKAFYMGASALLSILQKIPDEMSDEEGAKVLDQVHDECIAYLAAAAAEYDRRKSKGFGRGSGNG